MSLTNLKIKSAKPREKKYKLYDSDYLYLEVYPNGKKQYMYKYKNLKEFKIGNYPALSLKEARQKRNRLKREIDFIGLDEVVRELQETKLQPKRKFDNVIDEWIKIYSKGKAPATTKKTIERVNRYITPAFRGKDISKTSIKEIYNLLGKVEKPTAEKLKSILNGIFSYAISKEYTKHNIIKDIDLNQIFQTTIKTNSHYSFITELEEIKTYFRALEDLKDRTIVKGAIKIIWLTALRQGSVRLIKWEHIDFDNKTLFIPKENLKVKVKDFIIPLNDEAIKVFRELEKIKQGDYVFYSSNNYNKIISETALRNFQKDISIKYNISYQTLHGIRHTFATLTRQYIQKENNIGDEVIELSLQHLDKNQIREVYNHYDYLKERRELLNLWEKFLLNL
jgi:integrase